MKSRAYKEILSEFINESRKDFTALGRNALDLESKECQKILDKPVIMKHEVLKVLVCTHKCVLFDANERWKKLSSENSILIRNLTENNKKLEERLAKVSKEVKELVGQRNNIKLIEKEYESSVFNYNEEIKQKAQNALTDEQSSCFQLSVAQEDSFDKTLENMDLHSKSNESSKDCFSIQNEEPKAKNL